MALEVSCRGLERLALTLHRALAEKGHEVHIFTTSSPSSPIPNLVFHLSKPTPSGYLEQAVVWKLPVDCSTLFTMRASDYFMLKQKMLPI
ncbi:hypothetical protein V6N11_009071 [Hibiscus sabdariffa]|uniref:Glycosyltransferase subfamily 4-like N-terminal domain-containing protein n=1 Tax=Hibiscus sabdariffa TaxID=183260 RepID=A0ABR2PPP0_9ROSI